MVNMLVENVKRRKHDVDSFITTQNSRDKFMAVLGNMTHIN